MSVGEFLASRKNKNAWVQFAGLSVYMRCPGLHVMYGLSVDTLDISNVEQQHERGKGEFWELVDVCKMWAEMLQNRTWIDGLYIENVLNERLALSLQNRGWTEVQHGDTWPSSYFLRTNVKT